MINEVYSIHLRTAPIDPRTLYGEIQFPIFGTQLPKAGISVEGRYKISTDRDYRDYGQGGSSRFACSCLYSRIFLRHDDRTNGQANDPIHPVTESVTGLSLSVIPVIIFYISLVAIEIPSAYSRRTHR
jgi:hypothetical protein